MCNNGSKIVCDIFSYIIGFTINSNYLLLHMNTMNFNHIQNIIQREFKVNIILVLH